MDKKTQRKVLTASLVGSSIEWFDFFLYASVASTIFSTQYFVSDNAALSRMIAYFGLALSFFIRPFGGVIFSHIGDKIGRKKTLVLTLTLMGVATVGIGLLPTYNQIGIFAPLLLLFFRLVQGLGISGEWGGALLLATEYAPKEKRGFFGSVPQMGVTIGMVLGSLSFYTMTAVLSEEAFASFGWRIPFILSAFLVLFGLWIRKDLDETPDFKETVAQGKVPALPIVDTFKKHWKEVIVTSCAKFIETAPFYIFGTFIVSYATVTLGFSFSTVMLVVMTSAILTTLLIPFMGALSDKVGRRNLYLTGVAFMFLYMIPYFLLLQTGSTFMLLLATIIGLSIIWSPITAVLGTMFSEVFSKEIRYTGVTLGYQIGAAVAGGTAPMVAEFLMSEFNNSWLPVALYIMVLAVISFIAVLTVANKNRDSADIN
ncbi:MFS transporter [Phocicoccus pinnipedialis]|uniref:Inner membrane metabolite transport protein YhjE n=1 Tax=Phocicoccus pinnipedialis TaxID=110845 RepID=A0A6V7RBT4_9BACL|nr:MFS transporter [Jeotgalicoccus pinnipedialis]MBP1939533.1 metabolite-proton symporter [Jeotgalicoccus pinnipedialis]CAD2075005.1 Inner membrane metabolite transport protein YhjE [Jeotgalicoccus pinnipedialis]